MRTLFLFILSLCAASCTSQVREGEAESQSETELSAVDSQIAEYVTSVFKDSKGHLWFGTLQKGIARHDGKELSYFSSKDGLPSDRVIGVIQDSAGMYWFMTGEGLSRYDGEQFSNYRITDDWGSNMVASLLIDSKGIFWLGTWNGVYTFDGKDFHSFPIPYPEVDTPINEDTKNWITGLKEDPQGNIWIERDGYGLCKYDGKSFSHLLKKDGLHSNNVTDIAFDQDGSLWIGTRVAERDNPDPEKRHGKGGLNRLLGAEMLSFPEIESFNSGDVYEVYKDHSDRIWISTVKDGVYRFDGQSFAHYPVPISIMQMLDDQQGNIWLGGAGGLYRINQAGEVIHVGVDGPWDRP